ncbi:MAG: gliding motility-associated C-terminal domain-containing protein [Saprospiraceae bacterium]|nr:gliding motility-associated C-terminal domain-containing protein [Saprospiraceae bacterium]
MKPFIEKIIRICLIYSFLHISFIVSSQTKFFIPSKNVLPGEKFCTAMQVEKFDSILSFLITFTWDSTVLKLDSYKYLLSPSGTGNLTGFSPKANALNVSFLSEDANCGLTLPDSTKMIEMCFTVLGVLNDSTSINITGVNNTPPDVVQSTKNCTDYVQIDPIIDVGKIKVLNNILPITLIGENKSIPQGDNVCIAFTTKDFQNITTTDFSINFDKNILSFTGINQILPAFNNAVFNTTNAVNGSIKVNWKSLDPINGLTIPDGFTLFAICFDAKGVPGSISNVSITGSPDTINVRNKFFPDKNIGIAPQNGSVTVLSGIGKPLTLNLNGPTTIKTGDRFCLDVSEKDFKDIIKTEYSIKWNNSKFSLDSIEILNTLSGLTANNFIVDNSNGNIQVKWDSPVSPTGITLANDVILYRLCFFAIAPGCNSDSFVISKSPLPINIITSTSNGNDIGLKSNSPNVSITSSLPTDIQLNMQTYFVEEQSKICVDVFCKDFKEIQSMQFSIRWDSSIAKLDSITSILPGFSTSSYNVNNLNGFSNIAWNNSSAVTYKDGSAVLTFCFKSVGYDGQMTPITIMGSPINIEIAKLIKNSNCTDDSTYIVNLQSVAGKITIKNIVYLTDTTIVKTTCCNLFRSGKINISPTGGTPPYKYSWSGPFGFTSSAQNLMNIGEGLYELTITDTVNHKFFGFFYVESDYSTPNVYVDSSALITCKDSLLQLSAKGDSTNISYFWNTLDGNIVSGSNLKTINIDFPGTYVVIASKSGVCCAVADTIVVTANQVFPTVALAKSNDLNCLNISSELDGTGSTAGNEMEYLWTTVNGNISSGNNTIKATISKGGMYYFKVQNTLTGCSKTDSIFVNEDKSQPNASIDPTSKLSCIMPSTVLVGNGPIGANFKYSWSTSNGNIVNGGTTLNPLVDKGGLYQLIISNTINGCKDTATLLVDANLNKPKSDAGALNQLLDCKKSNVTLGGGSTSTGVNYYYQWFRDGIPVTSGFNAKTIIANVKGQYLFEVVDTSSGCRDTSYVNITKDTLVPTATIKLPVNTITCTTPMIQLDGSGSSVGVRFNYLWKTVGGSISGATNTNITTVNDQGNYTLVVRDTLNNCIDSVSVNVIKNVNIPTAIISTNNAKITCDNPNISFNSTGSTSGSKIVYDWKTLNGNYSSTVNGNAAIADKTGNYYLVLTDTSNNCKDTSNIIVVNGNTTKPIVNLQTGTINCTDSILTINTTGTSIGSKITYSWKTTDGKFTTATNILNVKVNTGGNYSLVVKDTSNNCIDSSTVFISQDKVYPLVNAGIDKSLNCLDTLVLIDGNASSSGSKYEYTWTTIGGNIIGNNTFPTIQANKAGRYILSILDTKNGCKASDTALVIKNVVEPSISIASPATIKCPNSSVLVDASGSTAGDTIKYQWTTSNGSILGGELTNKLIVGLGGDYTLVVTNTKNQCKSTQTVKVNQAVFPPVANAGKDQIVCDSVTTLSANLPSNTTGEWTKLTGENITTLQSFETDKIVIGNNYFVWKLSTADCPNYSADTLTINRVKKPVAVNDLFDKPFKSDSILINLAKNDNPGSNWMLSLLTPPRLGTLNKIDEGNYSYSVSKAYFGNIIFTYLLCNKDCPDLCDSAEVKIVVAADPNGIDEYLPNVITPNNDGLNDNLVFDIIDINGKDYPQNEIVIYNRWGEIVYEASPYKNDWNGVNKSGGLLPQATYYYILRLNIPGGTIIRGDVTILKK